MRVTIQDGIDPRKFEQFIYQTVVAGAEAEGRAKAALESDRRKMAQKCGITPPPVQGDLFGGSDA